MRKKRLREAKVPQHEAELRFSSSLWSFQVAVLLLSDREEQIVQRTELGMCTSCIVGGKWTSQGGVVVGADRGKECHHLPWLFLFQDLLKVPEYSFRVSSFWSFSELD